MILNEPLVNKVKGPVTLVDETDNSGLAAFHRSGVVVKLLDGEGSW